MATLAEEEDTRSTLMRIRSTEIVRPIIILVRGKRKSLTCLTAALVGDIPQCGLPPWTGGASAGNGHAAPIVNTSTPPEGESRPEGEPRTDEGEPSPALPLKKGGE